MTTREIVAKLWNLCNVLRDDGITYHQYVTELTYILFLKMARETGTESAIPEACRWDVLAAKSGIELKHVYKRVLAELSENGTGRVREIYQGAVSNIDEPSMPWTGIPRGKRAWATCMKVCWKKMPMRKNPERASISRRACSLM